MNVIHKTTEVCEATMDMQTTLERYAGQLADNGKVADAADEFAHDNMAILRDIGFYTALIPTELGGGGLDFPAMAAALTQLATYHPSTALTTSMHTHIIAANRFNYMNGRPGQVLLEKVR